MTKFASGHTFPLHQGEITNRDELLAAHAIYRANISKMEVFVERYIELNSHHDWFDIMQDSRIVLHEYDNDYVYFSNNWETSLDDWFAMPLSFTYSQAVREEHHRIQERDLAEREAKIKAESDPMYKRKVALYRKLKKELDL